MFNRTGKLDIFEDFRVDRSLPKFKQSDVGLVGTTLGSTIVGTTSVTETAGRFIVVNNQNPFSVVVRSDSEPRSWWRELMDWWRDVRRVPIDQFFQSVRNSVEEVEVVESRMRGYLAAIEQAKANGQTALAEQLEASVEGVRAETQLVAMKTRKFLSEEQLVEFVKKAKKGLRLDWVANFTRVIPEHVVKAKQTADERGVFDNYVVLHYDPKKKAWAETEADKEKRKDPILFGVVKGRRRLYYVGDWTDEFCDLTFDQIADVLGADTIDALSRHFEVEAKAS